MILLKKTASLSFHLVILEANPSITLSYVIAFYIFLFLTFQHNGHYILLQYHMSTQQTWLIILLFPLGNTRPHTLLAGWRTLWHFPCPCLSDLCSEWHSDGCAKGSTDLHRNQGRNWEDEDGTWRHFPWSSWPAGVHSQIWKQESAVGASKTDVTMPNFKQPSKTSVISPHIA